METATYKITIDAPREKVWEVLWGDESYRDWTSFFSEGSSVETDWKQGSKILFLDGKGHGMVATVNENRYAEYLSIRHLGTYNNGVEDLESESVKAWAGALENYRLEDIDGETLLTVTCDVSDEYKKFFDEVWPKALARVKQLSEN